MVDKVVSCPCCGDLIVLEGEEGGNWLGCLPLDPRIVKIVAGRNYLVGTGYVYVDGNSKEYSRDEFIAAFNVDPDAVWEEVQKRRGGPTTPVRIGGNKPNRPPVKLGGQ